VKLDQVYPTGTSPDVFIADVVSLNALYKLENRQSYRHADPRRQLPQVAQRRVGLRNMGHGH